MSSDAARLRSYGGPVELAAGELTWEVTRLLTRAERVQVRAAHEFDFQHVAGQWTATCACGTVFTSEHAHQVSDASTAHVLVALEFVAGRKVAEARANAQLDAALVDGHQADTPTARARRRWFA